MSGVTVLIFSKAPVPGQVKTRLMPVLDARTATQLHRDLTEYTVANLSDPLHWQTQLWCSPDTTHPFFQELAARYPLQLHQQRGINLGERMSHAVEYAQKTNDRVILLGTDCPAMSRSLLVELSEELRSRSEAVIVPADDGGYVALGLKRYDPRLFADMEWGGDQVFARTVQCLQELGWTWKAFPGLWDVDRPEDYERLISSGLVPAHSSSSS